MVSSVVITMTTRRCATHGRFTPTLNVRVEVEDLGIDPEAPLIRTSPDTLSAAT